MKRIYLIIYIVLSVLFIPVSWLSARELGEWTVYPSYQIATQNLVVGKQVYSLMDGNLLRYDTEDESVRLYDCLNALNDFRIEHIAYSQEARKLILVYDNENIDLLDLDDNVFNIASLKDKVMSNKHVNSVAVYGKNAYLAMNAGFLVVDMKEGVVRDTYQFGVNVQSVAISNDEIWICGQQGVYSTPLSNPQMHNLSSWTVRHTAGNWFQIVPFDGDVYLRHKTAIYRFSNGRAIQFSKGTYNYLKLLSDGQLYFGNASLVSVCSSASSVLTVDFANTWNDVSLGASGIYWVSEGDNGLRTYRLADGTFTAGSGAIQPNSPRRDLFYRMHYDTDGKGGYRLLVAGGVNTFLGIYNPATAMVYEDGKWSYLDEVTPARDYPELRHYNTSDIVQAPSDPSRIYASPYRTGLYCYKDGKLEKLYSCWNSPLQSILPDNANYKNYVSATCLAFDEDENLWMCNQETDTIIRVLTLDRKWRALYYPEIAGQTQCDGYVFSSSGVRFLVCRRMEGRGFFAFDTNGTLTNMRDDKHRLLSTIVNQDGTSYSPDNFHCMTEDLDGRIWCGTDRGLFVIDDPSCVFDSDFRFTQIKIARNDGSDLADYLLTGVEIKCITVDGGNRKWIGTESNGVYLVSADGTELLCHFMEEDSPLLSNNVQCIAVNPQTGEVMLGTDKGLCSYQGDATEPESELKDNNVVAFPNPVRPDYAGQIRIEGLTYNAEVKICSVTGQLLWSGRSNGGVCVWNGCDKRGKRVASGVYNVISNTEDGNTAVVTRIVVIR